MIELQSRQRIGGEKTATVWAPGQTVASCGQEIVGGRGATRVGTTPPDVVSCAARNIALAKKPRAELGARLRELCHSEQLRLFLRL
jgi:hypothetical protein